jgi:FAD/FMN-containing dehydrogenase
VWNGMVDRSPALIVRPANSEDVALTIALAREEHVPLSVRGGGHSAAGFGTCDGGVVLDLSTMRTVRVDAPARVARVGGGSLWADVDAATQERGLAVTGGLVTHTGVGGLTLGGGMGHLMRRFGLTCDNLTGAELITADGDVVLVDETEHPDLLWALRGGGGNFGVATTFEFRLHEVGPTILSGAVIFPMTDAAAVLAFYRDWTETVTDAMTTVVALRAAPPAPFIPAEIHGEPILAVVVCWSGDRQEGERALEPLRRFNRPLVDRIAPRPYLEHQSMFDASAPHGRQNYKRNVNLAGLSDGAIEVLVEAAMRRTSPLSMTLIFQLGGAVGRLREEATAYSDRRAAFNVDINAQWTDQDDPRAEEHIQWVRDVHTALGPLSTGGAYVNFLMGDEGRRQLRSTYGDAKYQRLVELKRRYDPDNVFRLNQNIQPDNAAV